MSKCPKCNYIESHLRQGCRSGLGGSRRGRRGRRGRSRSRVDVEGIRVGEDIDDFVVDFAKSAGLADRYDVPAEEALVLYAVLEAVLQVTNDHRDAIVRNEIPDSNDVRIGQAPLREVDDLLPDHALASEKVALAEMKASLGALEDLRVALRSVAGRQVSQLLDGMLSLLRAQDLTGSVE